MNGKVMIVRACLLAICLSGAAGAAEAEKLADAKKPVAFVSATAGGKWSDLKTWATQDGAAPTRVPGAGDAVMIAGPVTVDAATSVGSGSGAAVTVRAADKTGAPKLTVAAELTVRGNLMLAAGSMLEGTAGGIQFDADKDVVPKITAVGGTSIMLTGKSDARFFVRTKAGSEGQPGCVEAAGPLKFAAQYTDFSDLGAASKTPSGGDWGRPGLKITAPTEPSALEHCNFTHTALSITGSATSAAIALSHCILSDTPKCGGGGVEWGAQIVCDPNNRNITLEACGFDQLILPQYLKSIRSCVLERNWYPFKPVLADEWIDNLSAIVEAPGNGTYFKPPGGTYRHSYWFCLDPESNAHVMFLHGTGEYTFSQCIWDVPVSPFVDDALNSAKEQKVLAERCLTLLRGGTDKANLVGCSFGYVYGGKVTYRNNTITLNPIGVYGDTSHGGKSGDMVGFHDNLCWLPDGAGKGDVFYNLDVSDWFKPEDVHHNALYNAQYFSKGKQTPLPSGAGDVTGQNPQFVDPSRRLINFHREQNKLPAADPKKAAEEGLAALEWMRQHPEKIAELIDWTFEGYRPQNPALKAGSDATGPTKGWIGAMEGKEGK